MTRHLVFSIISLLISSTLFAQKHTNYSDEVLDQSIQRTMERMHIPGLSIAVYQKGKEIYSKGYGLSDIENNINVNPITQFRMASVSKLITATAVATLIEKGEIDIDLPIENYLPDYPNAGKGVTTRYLLSHQAGIRHYEYKDYSKARPYVSTTDALSIFVEDSLIHTPGSGYKYSTYAFTLIQAVIEAVSGKSFLEYIQDAVLDPLNMHHTRADTNEPDGRLMTKLYQYEGGVIKESPWDDSSYKYGGGGMLSTADDLAKLGNSYLEKDLLSQETIHKMFSPQVEMPGALPTTHVGLTWRISEDEEGHKYYHHAGNMNGARSFLMVAPEEEIVVAVMSNNRQMGRIDVFARAIANHFTYQSSEINIGNYEFTSDNHQYKAKVTIDSNDPTSSMKIAIDTILDKSLRIQIATIRIKEGMMYYNLNYAPSLFYYKMRISDEPYLMVYVKNDDEKWEQLKFEKMKSY